MGIDTKYPAHPDLTGGGETTLHSHAGGGPTIATGAYVGNETAYRTIAHGLGTTPKLVFILERTGPAAFIIGVESYVINIGVGVHVLPAPSSTIFYVEGASYNSNCPNKNSSIYDWIAIG